MATVKYDLEQALGERIRAARRQAGLTLRDVERLTGGAVSSVALGSYERADRAMSVEKLVTLAEVYGVPAADLLPSADDAESRAVPFMTIDLDGVAARPHYQRGPLAALAQREGRGLTGSLPLPTRDVPALARTYGVEEWELGPLFDSWGIVVHPHQVGHSPGRKRPPHTVSRLDPVASYSFRARRAS